MFAESFAKKCLLPIAADLQVNPQAQDVAYPQVKAVGTVTPTRTKSGVFGWFFGGKNESIKQETSESGKKLGGGGASSVERPLSVEDFDLLNVVGKGAFGKVMLVRKKVSAGGEGAGEVYAMKVLKKSVIKDKGQIEHTKSERAILNEIKHPYIVQLRFAFQNEEKLYLVTDYYNGGTLFYHLRKANYFSEQRAKFYAAELLSALAHLHQQAIIYRDLKLENILMGHTGHIALTDFGLSKQGVDSSGGAETFCGTAEYIAPELLKNQKYGPAVDWWSFGILVFEMLQGRTPFYDKNRKLMYYRIVNTLPCFPSTFSPEACDTIRGLLEVDVVKRLGSQDATDIMASPFFQDLDFEKVRKGAYPVPFVPDVASEVDTKYVPKSYLNVQAKDSVAVASDSSNTTDFGDEFNFNGSK